MTKTVGKDLPQASDLGEPLPSVTENTTRTLEYSDVNNSRARTIPFYPYVLREGRMLITKALELIQSASGCTGEVSAHTVENYWRLECLEPLSRAGVAAAARQFND